MTTIVASDIAATVTRLNIDSGQRTPWKVLLPADRAGVVRVLGLQIGPDEKSYAYSYDRVLSELHLVAGLR